MFNNVTDETETKHDYGVAVVGGGPAGYILAIKAAHLGVKTVLIEKSVLGGTCLNRGCIPAKSYLRTAEIIENKRLAPTRGIISPARNLNVDIEKVIACKNSTVKRLTSGVSTV